MVNRELKKKVSQSPLHRTDFRVIELVWQVIPHFEALKKISILKVLLAKSSVVITRLDLFKRIVKKWRCSVLQDRICLSRCSSVLVLT